MQSNTLKAFKNILDDPLATVNPARISSNRINNVGDALEVFVKDAYSGTLGDEFSQQDKDRKYSEYFCWLGNKNQPPDSILRGGDGIEVKKINLLVGNVPLNSSSPKNKLRADDSRVANGAKLAEVWDVKDIVYAIGSTPDDELRRLWFIYGDCYAASKETYEKLDNVISEGISLIPDVEFHATNELGKVKKVDPLGITDMRIRGMWHIDSPSRLYSDLVTLTPNRQYYLLMREEKYQSFPEEDRLALENINADGFSNSIIDIRDPDNPARLLRARFIKYEF